MLSQTEYITCRQIHELLLRRTASKSIDEYFIPLSSLHCQSTRLATSNNLFLTRVNSSSGKCSPTFVGPKVSSSIPNDIKFSTTFTFKWKLKKHLLHEKGTQLWTLATFHLSRTKIMWIVVFCNWVYFLCIFTLKYIFCTSCAFRRESTLIIFFCFGLFLFCISLMIFVAFLLFVIFFNVMLKVFLPHQIPSLKLDSLICVHRHALSPVHFLHSVLPSFCFIMLIWPTTIVFQHVSTDDEWGWLTRSGLLKLWVATKKGAAKCTFGVAKYWLDKSEKKLVCRFTRKFS